MFWMSRDGAYFQSVVSATKEAELVHRKEFGDPKKVCLSEQFLGTSPRGKDISKGDDSFRPLGWVGILLTTLESGEGPRASHSIGKRSSSFQ